MRIILDIKIEWNKKLMDEIEIKIKKND
jgi:hypothetical protein